MRDAIITFAPDENFPRGGFPERDNKKTNGKGKRRKDRHDEKRSGNPKPDGIPRHFAIDRLRRGCVEPPLATAPRFYARSRELRKLRRAETTRRCRRLGAISQPPDILHLRLDWLLMIVDDDYRKLSRRRRAVRRKFPMRLKSARHCAKRRTDRLAVNFLEILAFDRRSNSITRVIARDAKSDVPREASRRRLAITIDTLPACPDP